MTWDEFSQKLNDKMDKTFKPTREWMAAKYAEMNEQLFNGSLGNCSFDIFIPSNQKGFLLKIVLILYCLKIQQSIYIVTI